MKFVLYGNFVVPYCSEVHHAKSLEALGHEIVRLQETEITTERVLSESIDSNGLIWIHSHGFQNKGVRSMASVLETLKKQNIQTIAYHLDLYMGLERFREYQKHDYFKIAHFFTVDKLMADWLNENTQTKGYYLPAGVLSEEVYSLNVPKIYDVIFVGSRGYHPEWPYRPELIDWLQNTYGARFAHFGGDGRGVVRGAELNKLYAQSKVVVGDTLCPGFDYPYYFSDRLFETIGRGGFIIFPYIKGIDQFFELGTELITYTYRDWPQLRAKIDHYLMHEDEREQIRQAGYARVATEHTYMNRWRQIIKILYG